MSRGLGVAFVAMAMCATWGMCATAGATRIPVVRITAIHHTGRAYEMARRVGEARELIEVMRHARPAEWPARVVVDWSEAASPENLTATIHIAVGWGWDDDT